MSYKLNNILFLWLLFFYFDGSQDSIRGIVEKGIDSLLDDGLFKDIPIVVC